MLLLLKQTVESSDRQRVLHTGDERTYVDPGAFFDIAYAHQVPGSLTLSVAWKPEPALPMKDPVQPRTSFTIPKLRFSASIKGTVQMITVDRFEYSFQTNDHDESHQYRFGMKQRSTTNGQLSQEYELIAEGYDLKRTRGRPKSLPAPVSATASLTKSRLTIRMQAFLPILS
ncbi:MAG: hypothetical protein RMJ54_09390 [Roseiflexaceae bacterium]|nr:hypothetical protein [Roseiflexus sp.]MDW8232982.1 hypothetical protein [Roseiflexaceae bacterium]